MKRTGLTAANTRDMQCIRLPSAMHLQPLICVQAVEASSRWYQKLLDLKSGHGDATLQSYGNGVLLWFEVDDFEAAVGRAIELKANILRPSELSEDGNWECWLQDPNGYKLVLASPLPRSLPQA